jgi:hypothetical protein
MLNVVMLNVVMQNAIMMSVVAPHMDHVLVSYSVEFGTPHHRVMKNKLIYRSSIKLYLLRSKMRFYSLKIFLLYFDFKGILNCDAFSINNN